MKIGPEQAPRDLDIEDHILPQAARFHFLSSVSSEVSRVSVGALLAIDEAMAAQSIPSISNPQGDIKRFVAKVISKLQLPVSLYRSSRGPIFVGMMGLMEYKTVPFCYWTEIVPYCFDCWEPEWARWESFFRRHRMRLAFFTARQSASHLPSLNAVWLPEAVDPSKYQSKRSLKERNIDVIEFGRKYDHFHDAITDELSIAGKIHKSERIKGEIIFPTTSDFISELGNSKISICFPRSLTHPKSSGASVETVTQRYFESIASKCVVVGRCPSELADLFGYNPVIEINDGTELDQINSILAQIDQFQPLVEKNYARLLETATLAARVQTISRYMNSTRG